MAKKTKSIKTVLEAKNPFVKDNWADFAASHLRPKFLIYRFDDKRGNRFYYFKDGENIIVAAGSTTVFGKVSTERERLAKWRDDHPDWRRLLDISSDYGTLEHMTYGDIMFGKGVDPERMKAMQQIVADNEGGHNMPAKDILSFLRFQEDYNLVPLLIEASLIYKDPVTGKCLAMTIDLLAKMTVTTKIKTQVEDGVFQRGANVGKPRFKDVVTEKTEEKILVIDFKSNFFEKDRKSFFEIHKLQLQAAKIAVEQNFDLTVDDCYNYAPNNWRTEPSYTFYKWDLDQADWTVFFDYWKLAQDKNINEPEGKMLITEGFKNSKDFKFLTYKEYVEQVLMKEIK